MLQVCARGGVRVADRSDRIPSAHLCALADEDARGPHVHVEHAQPLTARPYGGDSD